MIIDNIGNAKQYYGLSKNIQTALEFLQNMDSNQLVNGKNDIDGDALFLFFYEYDTRYKDEGVLEAHKKYLDLQYIVDGKELIGYKNIRGLKPIDEYCEDKDIYFFEGECDFIEITKDMFIILYPEDGHMPCISKGKSNKVKKIVAKIKLG